MVDIPNIDLLGFSVSGSSLELKNGQPAETPDPEMNKMIMILGVIVAVIGVGGYADATYTHIILTGTHHTIPLAGLGIAVLGALLAVGGVLMGKPSAAAANQFKCSACGAVFNSQSSLDQHTNAKHANKN